uniref:Uncharacterized protein n=1 Tax=Hyaloperonospora arabidopsidis (strain Emoy2) TaxID=559515 RepID=M4BSV6_HYAAE
MELFAGFNAEELAMMQELLRLLVEDDDALTQQPIPGTLHARQDSQSMFQGLAGASPKLGGGTTFDGGYYLWNMGGPNSMAWNAPPAMLVPVPQLTTKAARTRTRSTALASDEEPMLKRGRVDVTPTMMTPMNHIAVPDGYSYY